METLELACAETGRALGVGLDRKAAITSGAYCRSTNIFLMNAEGKILCHQRSKQKERHPGVWSTHLGGHIALGETFESNAQKEVEEECGISLKHSELIAWRTTQITKAHLWVREFVAFVDKPTEAFTPQPGEVDAFAWKSPEEILAEVKTNPDMWLAGTHHFASEYMCLRAALTASTTLGAVTIPESLQTWHHLA